MSYTGKKIAQESAAASKNTNQATSTFSDQRVSTTTQLKQQQIMQNALNSGVMATSQIVQRRDILGSPHYTDNFKERHVRADNVTEDVAAVRMANTPPPPSSTVIDQRTVAKSVKAIEESRQVSKTFEINAGGWNVYFGTGGSLRAKKVQRIKVNKDDTAKINHLASCTEQGNEKVRQEDGTWR